jgi:4-amino-4-deoxy-L-arabinose transferase-like glycosyltransferase
MDDAQRQDTPSSRIRVAHPGLWAALGLGLALKAALLASGSVMFGSDEAILGLMARHILQGERPVFFYGQSYMGALDAYLIAPFFLVFGQSVLAIRLTQVALYLGVLVTTYFLALRLSKSRFGASAAALLVALPPVMFSLYTTSTLGDYVEILLLNNLLFLIGWGFLDGELEAPGWWLLAGFLGGLGWWGMALIMVSIIPLAFQANVALRRHLPYMKIALLSAEFRRHIPWGKLGLLVVGFAVGALPWIVYTLGSGLDTLDFLLAGAGAGGAATQIGPGSPLIIKSITLFLFNLPALFGLRPPWGVDWIALPVGVLVAAVYLGVLAQAARTAWQDLLVLERRIEQHTLVMAWGLLIAVFFLSPFGYDPSGRYLLPLYPLLAALCGDWLARIRPGRLTCNPIGIQLSTAGLILALCLGYNLWGNVRAMLDTPPGLTTQFSPVTQIPHEHDGELIAFLDELGVDRGYSNYWVAYRFAFLTDEEIILLPLLPYKENLSYHEGDDRYPPYRALVEEAERVVYVTSNLPQLDEELRARFTEIGVAFRERAIGPYTVFYDLPRPVRPGELGLGGEQYP